MVARAGGLLSPIGQRVILDGRPYPLTLATAVFVGSGLFATYLQARHHASLAGGGAAVRVTCSHIGWAGNFAPPRGESV